MFREPSLSVACVSVRVQGVAEAADLLQICAPLPQNMRVPWGQAGEGASWLGMTVPRLLPLAGAPG